MLKKLRSQHRNIIHMSFSGFKNNEIADQLGMSQASISLIIRSPLGQAYLNGLIDKAKEDTIDVRKRLIGLNKQALGAIERILDPDVKAPYNVQLTAAKDVLDRNGFKPSDKFEIDVFSHKSDDEIEKEINIMEAAIARNQLSKANPPKDNDDNNIDDDSEVYSPLPLAESDLVGDKSGQLNTTEQSDTAMPASTSDATDIDAKFASEAFDPFKNI